MATKKKKKLLRHKVTLMALRYNVESKISLMDTAAARLSCFAVSECQDKFTKL